MTHDQNLSTAELFGPILIGIPYVAKLNGLISLGDILYLGLVGYGGINLHLGGKCFYLKYQIETNHEKLSGIVSFEECAFG